MSPSRAASAPSRTPTGCWRMSAAATATLPELSLDQISEQLSLGVDRVMTEGSLYDRELAALAIKQARGDLIEAIFLVRAFRTTLPRFGATEPVDTGDDGGRAAHFGDLQGSAGRPDARADLRLHPPPARSAIGRRRRRRNRPRHREAPSTAMPRVTDILGRDGLIEPSPRPTPMTPVGDLTREPLELSGRPRSAAAGSGARRRRLSAGARLFDAARLRPQPSLRRRNPHRRGRGRICAPRMSALPCRSARSR